MDSIERLKSRFFVWLILAVVALPSTVLAQSPEPRADLSDAEKKEVATFLLEAKRAYSSKDYEIALERLQSAYAIFPDVNVQRRIGETLERLRRDREALEVYRQVLTRDDVSSSMRDAVERRVAFLSDLLEKRRATVRVTSNLVDTRIYVEDESEPRGTAPIELRLDPGAYTIRAELPERQTRTFDVDLSEREVVDWSVEWQVVDSSSTGEDSQVAASAPSPDGASSSSAVAWLFLGVGVTSYAASATTFILASNVGSTLDDYDDARGAERPTDYAELESRHNNFVIASWVGAAVGTVATGIGAYLLLSSGSDSAEISIVPGPAGARVEARWRW